MKLPFRYYVKVTCVDADVDAVEQVHALLVTTDCAKFIVNSITCCPQCRRQWACRCGWSRTRRRCHKPPTSCDRKARRSTCTTLVATAFHHDPTGPRWARRGSWWGCSGGCSTSCNISCLWGFRGLSRCWMPGGWSSRLFGIRRIVLNTLSGSVRCLELSPLLLLVNAYFSECFGKLCRPGLPGPVRQGWKNIGFFGQTLIVEKWLIILLKLVNWTQKMAKVK